MLKAQRRKSSSKSKYFEQQELLKKAEVVREGLTVSTWRELEIDGKFNKNEKLSFISDDMLILGCDVGSETHYIRANDTRGRELSKLAFPFSNDSGGFQSAKEWAVKIANELTYFFATLNQMTYGTYILGIADCTILEE